MAITLYGNKQNIIQVVSTTLATPWTGSSTSFIDVTGLSVSITPSSASNKILVIANISVNNGGSDGNPFRITRNGTAVGVGSAVGSRLAATGVSGSNVTNGSVGSVGGNYLDSPATTSTLTYQIQAVSSSSGNTIYVNRTGTYTDSTQGYNSTPISTITVMEIAYA